MSVGVLAGLGASTVLGQFLGSQLYETTPTDPVTLAESVTAAFGGDRRREREDGR